MLKTPQVVHLITVFSLLLMKMLLVIQSLSKQVMVLRQQKRHLRHQRLPVLLQGQIQLVQHLTPVGYLGVLNIQYGDLLPGIPHLTLQVCVPQFQLVVLSLQTLVVSLKIAILCLHPLIGSEQRPERKGDSITRVV